MEELIAAAAAAMNAPEELVHTSAQARAQADGLSVEDVLRSWAGDGAPAVADAEPKPAPVAEAPAPAEPVPTAEASAPAAEAPAAAAAPAGDMASLLAAAAAATGMSESMVERSAGARAKAQGTTVEAVLAEWAGQDAPAPAAAAPAAEAPTPAADTPAAPAAADPPAELEVEVIGEAPPAEEPEAAVEAEEPASVGALPRWLVALFIVIPSFAVAYALFLPNGPACGDAGRLAVDPVSGELVNCDGSEIGASEIDFFAIGLEQYSATGCVGCHGPDGAGLANFPAFTGGAVLETFPEGSCADHVEWVRLGSTGWPNETYGAQSKPVGGSGAVMPGFASLSDEQLRSVALYERVQFGGQELESALSDCGLGDAAPAASE